MSCCLSFASQETDELSVSAVGHSTFCILHTGKALSANKAQGSEFSKKVAPYTVILIGQKLRYMVFD